MGPNRMQQYQAIVKALIAQFVRIDFHHVPRSENQTADALATLASTMELPTGSEIQTVVITTALHQGNDVINGYRT